jgi:hypothetical protein
MYRSPTHLQGLKSHGHTKIVSQQIHRVAKPYRRSAAATKVFQGSIMKSSLLVERSSSNKLESIVNASFRRTNKRSDRNKSIDTELTTDLSSSGASNSVSSSSDDVAVSSSSEASSSVSSNVSGFDSSESDSQSEGSYNKDDDSTEALIDDESLCDSDYDRLNSSDSSLELLIPSTKTQVLPDDTPQANDSLSHIPSLLDNVGGDGSDDEEDLFIDIPTPCEAQLTDMPDQIPTSSNVWTDDDASSGGDTFASEAKSVESFISMASKRSVDSADPPPPPRRSRKPRKKQRKRVINIDDNEDACKNYDLDSSTHSTNEALSKSQRIKDEMDASIHSIQESQAAIEALEKGVEQDFEDVQKTMKDIELQSVEGSRKAGDGAQSVIQKKMAEKQALRKARMEKVRARIAREKEEKDKAEQEEKDKQKLKDSQAAKLDFSEESRRERAYTWYTRSGMPNKKNYKERIQAMPLSSGITEEDIDLLPWNARNDMVNVAKMNAYLFKR